MILEDDILFSFYNQEIDTDELIELYNNGYISENTMDYLVNQLDILEEGAFTRGLRAIGHTLSPSRTLNKTKRVYNLFKAARSASKKDQESAKKHMKNVLQLTKDINDSDRDYNKAQYNDAKETAKMAKSNNNWKAHYKNEYIAKGYKKKFKKDNLIGKISGFIQRRIK